MSVKIEEVTLSKSKKSYRVKLSGKWYGANLDSGIEQLVGREVEAAITTTDFGPWIDGYKPVGVATPTMAPAPMPAVGPSYIAEPQKQVNPNLSEGELRFVSNICAAAITGGKCSTPTEVASWAIGAKAALKAVI